MLKISPAQRDRFAQAMGSWFADRMVERVAALFPGAFAALGDASVREVVDDGIAAAAQYGIKAEIDVAHYIDLMFELSFDFDTSERFPWAGAILRDPHLGAADALRLIDLAAGAGGGR